MYTAPIIDGGIFHDWSSITELAPYLSAGWRELLLRPNSTYGPNEVRSRPQYRHPFGKARATDGRRAGSDVALTLDRALSAEKTARAVLGYDDALLSIGWGNEHVARVLAAAANDWTLDQWVSRDSRLGALALIAAVVPEAAASEIRRVGADERIVGVALGVNALGMPFGHPVYHPIYEAASELGLPIVIQVGSDSGSSLLAAPIGGGIASTYAETTAWGAHPLMSHLSSMIFDGVFDFFPDLKVLLVGGGVCWIPPFVWRLDFWYNVIHAEAPTLQALPSEYVHRHARFATYQLESAPDSKQLQTALGSLPWIDDVLLYASGHPNDDGQEPHEAASRIPEDWLQKVLHDNAADFFRWPRDQTATSAAVSVAGATD